jgi:nucleotide-binding universal stress UspA family protein
MFKRILVPVDLTKKSQAAVDLAYEFATRSPTEVILQHVIETIEHVQFDELKPFYERLEKSARKGLSQFSQPFAAGKLSVDQVIVYGRRANEIVSYAAAKRVDLIIMSSHRIESNQPAHSWSISYAVAILAPCPVLLVK